MANPRIEEVSDEDDDDDIASDPDEQDLESFDFARPQKGSLQPSDPDPTTSSQINPEALLSPQPDLERAREQSQNYQCIYPVYFDATRSRQEGRRVRKEDAVPNPLARDIVDAVQHVVGGGSMQMVFEPSKCHPKDWANPGRVRVLVKEGGRAVCKGVRNKHHLYTLISTYLKSHPTTPASPLKLRLQGLPPPPTQTSDGNQQQPDVAPAGIPRGFKIGNILPLHSPALSGGGVSDNFLKDMMAEMGGQLPEGMANMVAGGGGSSGKGKKVKVVRGK